MRRRTTSADIDYIGNAPRPGEIWWCEGDSLSLLDGNKTRPVLIVSVHGTDASVIPLTSQNPTGAPTLVPHRGGQSWLTGSPRYVPLKCLISSLGSWSGFAAWKQRR